jgi:hypothetical protein
VNQNSLQPTDLRKRPRIRLPLPPEVAKLLRPETVARVEALVRAAGADPRMVAAGADLLTAVAEAKDRRMALEAEMLGTAGVETPGKQDPAATRRSNTTSKERLK